MRAAVYIRVSSEEQAKHGYSLAGQLEACHDRAQALGATEIVDFADEGVSGALLSRPGLGALREALREGGIKLVVVLDPDRFARNLSHQLLLTEEVEKVGARLEFVNFEWRNTPEGQLFYAMRGAIAQYEKEKIRERTSRGRTQKAKSGKLPLAFKPYGYRYDSDLATLVVEEEEASVVRQMFRMLVEQGLGPNAIAKRLNDRGVRTKKGTLWHRVVVKQILAHECYVGVFHTNRYDCAGVGLNKHRPKSERVSFRERPQSEWIPVQVPAIVERRTWDEAQQLLSRARRLWAGQSKEAYLLSGLVSCGVCQQTLCGVNRRMWNKKVRHYTCRKGWAGARHPGCQNHYILADRLERAVWDQFVAWLSDPDTLVGEMMDKVEPTGTLDELAELKQHLAKAEQGKANVLAVLESGAIEVEEGTEALKRIRARHKELSARIHEIETALQRMQVSSEDRERAREIARNWLGRIEEMSMDERKQLLRQVVTRVIVTDRKVTIHARWPALFSVDAEIAACAQCTL